MVQETTNIPYENTVHICGRVAQAPVLRTLPSGDELTLFRVIVNRTGRGRRHGRLGVDAFECVVWSVRVQKPAQKFEPDDVVEVKGQLRRRFQRVGTTTTSRVEIEVSSCRRIRRGA